LAYEQLDFKEKLDTLSELIIRYDNMSYFSEKNKSLAFSYGKNGYELAREIMLFKKNI